MTRNGLSHRFDYFIIACIVLVAVATFLQVECGVVAVSSCAGPGMDEFLGRVQDATVTIFTLEVPSSQQPTVQFKGSGFTLASSSPRSLQPNIQFK